MENYLNESEKQFCRRYLLLNFSNDGQHPNEVPLFSKENWRERTFALEGIDFAKCQSLDLRRFKAIQNETHEFIDLTFLEANCHFEDGTFLNGKAAMLYEELQSVEWSEVPMDLEEDDEEEDGDGEDNRMDGIRTFSDSSWGEYAIGSESAEEDESGGEGPDRNSGHILIGYESALECPSFRQFHAEWRNWCAVRDLCESLPSKCTFRKVTFYQASTQWCRRYKFLLLLEVESALCERSIVCNCINNAQALCFNRAFIGLYEEIEFEIELNTLQLLVAQGDSINCNGYRLLVKFGQKEIVKEKLPMFPAFFDFSSGPSGSSSFYSEPQQTTSYGGGSNDQISASNSIPNRLAGILQRSNSDWRFDAEMDEIGAMEEGTIEERKAAEEDVKNRNIPLEMIAEGEEEREGQPKTSLNNNTGAYFSRKNSWRFIKHLFNPSSPPTNSMELEDRCNNNNNNGSNKMMQGNGTATSSSTDWFRPATSSDDNSAANIKRKAQRQKSANNFSLNSLIGNFSLNNLKYMARLVQIKP